MLSKNWSRRMVQILTFHQFFWIEGVKNNIGQFDAKEKCSLMSISIAYEVDRGVAETQTVRSRRVFKSGWAKSGNDRNPPS
mmetsp:Transcript_10264/g.24616  ORF Transcript_10264/g.24616 Transcript_10264/m.24616 type:complete len:81 (+) Transcript_10264:556-798(+)